MLQLHLSRFPLSVCVFQQADKQDNPLWRSAVSALPHSSSSLASSRSLHLSPQSPPLHPLSPSPPFIASLCPSLPPLSLPPSPPSLHSPPPSLTPSFPPSSSPISILSLTPSLFSSVSSSLHQQLIWDLSAGLPPVDPTEGRFCPISNKSCGHYRSLLVIIGP